MIDVKLALGLPSYDGRRHNALSLLALQKSVLELRPIQAQTSLLAQGFNIILCEALRMRDAGEASHFLMLHDDVVPCNPDWFDVMWREYHAVKAQLMSAVIPFKNASGLTSTAVDNGNPWGPRRLTTTQCMAEPETFTMPGLLLNSGCMLFDLRQDWIERSWFTIRDDIVVVDGVRKPRVASEDWNFTRMAREAGCERIFATRAVQIFHMGGQAFPNWGAWGQVHDTGDR